MSTHRTYFSDVFPIDEIGLITGSSTVTRFPSVPGSVFRLKALPDNNDEFRFGTSSGTVAFPLAPGDDTGWFTLASRNLNSLFFYSVSGSVDYITYWVQK